MQRVSALNLVSAIFCLACLAQQNNPYADDAAAADTGRGVFRIYCGPCHGMRAQGGRSGPDLTRGVFHAGDRDADLFGVITNGVPGTEMQSYSFLPPDMVWRVVAFIRSTAHPSGETAKGDAAHGAELFWKKGACGQCHAVGARGGWIGPELTRIGRQRSLAHLRESIVSPNADPTPGYETVTVITKAGTKITGIEKGYDNFTVQLLDLSQNYHSFERNQLASITQETRSLMPGSYGKTFEGSELDDLVAYLASLQGAGDR
ncbi:MAG: c-type cytochrome [Acidobacteriota bacterium]|nr:c-type cytochrome [Acidobacteriota bacterium]